jgi:C4-dicarboxylate-binding protein DctP
MTNMRVGKSLRALAGAAVIGAGTLAFAATVPTAAQAETKLRITLQLPLKNILGQNLVAFKEQVEKESAGDLKVEIYDSAQLYKDKEVPQAVASGAIEMGVAAHSRFADTAPAIDVFNVPFMFNDPAAITKATSPDSPIRQAIDAEILKTGARVLWWQAFGMAVMLSKGEPIIEPADVKDKKVRVFGKLPGEMIKVTGGAPTLLSGSEQFLAYQRGTVDAGMTGVTAVKSRKLYEVMDYTIVTNHAALEFVVLINEKVWQGLTDGQRKIVAGAARKVEQDLRSEYAKIDAGVLDWVGKETKMKVVQLNDAQRAAWRKATEPVLQNYLKQAGPLGEKMVAEARKLQ